MFKIMSKIFLATIFLTFFVNAIECRADVIPDKSKDEQNYTLMLKTDFADKTVKPWAVHANPGDISVVLNPSDYSKKVMKAHINIKEDFSHVVNGAPRAEILNAEAKLKNDFEYIITFNTYLPSDFQIEKTYNNPHCFFQVHQDILSGSPQLSLGIDKYNYRMTSNSSTAVHPEYMPTVRTFGNVNDDLGKWVKWAIYYKPSYSEKGRIIIFKDHKLVLDFKGVTAYDDITGYLKFGLYKWNWQKTPSSTTEITTYFSDINIYKMK